MGTPVVLYLLLSVIPNLIGCLVPESYCLAGSDKLVDVLTISAYVIPIILIIVVFHIGGKKLAYYLLVTCKCCDKTIPMITMI